MTRAFNHLVDHAHSLSDFRNQEDSDRIPAMLRQLRVASSGERVMILAAFSLLPTAWLKGVVDEDTAREIPPLRLSDASPLDADNTKALVEAIALHTGHPEVTRM